MKLSIIIINFNTGALTHACLESLLKQKLPKQTEIIVVDNGSSDNSVPFLRSDFPEITVIDNKQNRGFAHGLNKGVSQARGKYYLILNPDIIALPNAVSNLISFLENNPKVGIAAGQLLSPNGDIQDSSFCFYTPMTILYRRTFLGRTKRGQAALNKFLMHDFDHKSVRDVEWLMGSCLAVNAKAAKEVGGMDERFFLYFEDVDWCRRFWAKGWRVTYVPTAHFSHFHQRRSKQNPWLGVFTNWTTREHIRSAIKYFLKYKGQPRPKIT